MSMRNVGKQTTLFFSVHHTPSLTPDSCLSVLLCFHLFLTENVQLPSVSVTSSHTHTHKETFGVSLCFIRETEMFQIDVQISLQWHPVWPYNPMTGRGTSTSMTFMSSPPPTHTHTPWCTHHHPVRPTGPLLTRAGCREQAVGSQDRWALVM